MEGGRLTARAPRHLLRLLRRELPPILLLLPRRLVHLALPCHGVTGQRPHTLVERAAYGEQELAVADGTELPQ